jgi:hypothetical protein
MGWITIVSFNEPLLYLGYLYFDFISHFCSFYKYYKSSLSLHLVLRISQPELRLLTIDRIFNQNEFIRKTFFEHDYLARTPASLDVVDYFFRPLNNEKSFPNNILLLSRACSIGLTSAILRRSISDRLFFTFKNDSGPAVNL